MRGRIRQTKRNQRSRRTSKLVATRSNGLRGNGTTGSKSRSARVHANDIIHSLDRDVFPAIGSLPITSLTPPKILEVLTAIEDRGVIETAKRLRQRISAVFTYAIAKGGAPKGRGLPCSGSRRKQCLKAPVPALHDAQEQTLVSASVVAAVTIPSAAVPSSVDGATAGRGAQRQLLSGANVRGC